MSVCEQKAVSLVDIEDRGLRPKIDSQKCKECSDCLKVCPGISLIHEQFNSQTVPELRKSWGPLLELWEGYASNPEIRYRGSSGGAVTAIAQFCLEKEGMAGVLHIGSKTGNPLQNAAFLSKSKEELLARAGSRYSPAAVCEKLERICGLDAPCVFIGKPCEIAALRKVQTADNGRDINIGLTISIFCAGTPSSKGTKVILGHLGINSDDVAELSYRGCGWPGETTIKTKGDDGLIRRMTYEESWGKILNKHVQTRCRLCPDSTGEFADISCGDPWYRELDDELGQSLIVVRTERGREILRKAENENYIELKKANNNILQRSQFSLLRRRQHLWGRLFAMRMMFIPVPIYRGFSLFGNWLELSLIEKLRSIGGTFKRIFQRKWTKALELF